MKNQQALFSHITPRPKWKQILTEFWFMFIYFFVYQFTGIFQHVPNHLAGRKRAVVLVSGWLGRPPAWKAMRKRLIEAGYPVYTVPLGFQMGNIYKKGKVLEEFLVMNRINNCYLVCHSMGGLIAWSMMQFTRRKIRRIITLGTPFRGTFLSYFAFLINSARQMMPHSKFMKDLHRNPPSAVKFRSLHASCDQIVVPTWYSQLLKDDDITVPEFGHMNLFMGPVGIEYTLSLLRWLDKRKR